MSLTRKCCVHCHSLVARRLSLCPNCDRWMDEPSPWGRLWQELARLRGSLVYLGLLVGFLVWAFRHV